MQEGCNNDISHALPNNAGEPYEFETKGKKVNVVERKDG